MPSLWSFFSLHFWISTYFSFLYFNHELSRILNLKSGFKVFEYICTFYRISGRGSVHLQTFSQRFTGICHGSGFGRHRNHQRIRSWTLWHRSWCEWTLCLRQRTFSPFVLHEEPEKAIWKWFDRLCYIDMYRR